MKIKENGKDSQILWHILMAAWVCLTLFPIVFAVCNSFKTNSEAINSVMRLIPEHPTVENYLSVFQKLPFFRIAMNTFIIAVVVTGLKTVTSLLAAYAFVYFDFQGKSVLYFAMLMTLFIPFTVTMIPNYLLISRIGYSDHIIGVMLPQLADVLGIFMLRQAMRGINRSLIEAAKLDSIGDIKIMTDIVIPLVRPALVSTGIIFFINSWNEYVWPVLILKSKQNFTLSLALQMFISAEGGTNFAMAMAVSVMTMIIPLILYLFFQRYIINTFVMSGIKG